MINTIIGLTMFILSLLIGGTLWYFGASTYWIVSILAFGGCGLLFVLVDAIPSKSTKEQDEDSWMNDPLFDGE